MAGVKGEILSNWRFHCLKTVTNVIENILKATSNFTCLFSSKATVKVHCNLQRSDTTIKMTRSYDSQE